jgi:flagellar operon protein
MSVPVHNPALVPPIGTVGAPAPAQPPTSGAHGPSFVDVLRQRAVGVEFSKHAVQRLERRGIAMDPPTLQRLDEGVSRAATKGARDAVVFVDGTAFVCSVQNRTVITAVDRDHMRDHVFTNIDSAVIA